MALFCLICDFSRSLFWNNIFWHSGISTFFSTFVGCSKVTHYKSFFNILNQFLDSRLHIVLILSNADEMPILSYFMYYYCTNSDQCAVPGLHAHQGTHAPTHTYARARGRMVVHTNYGRMVTRPQILYSPKPYHNHKGKSTRVES